MRIIQVNMKFFGKAVLAAIAVLAVTQTIEKLHKLNNNLALEYAENTSIHSPSIDEFVPIQVASSEMMITGSLQGLQDEAPKANVMKVSSGWSINRSHKASLEARFE